jgi:hypothetical protein
MANYGDLVLQHHHTYAAPIAMKHLTGTAPHKQCSNAAFDNVAPCNG